MFAKLNCYYSTLIGRYPVAVDVHLKIYCTRETFSLVSYIYIYM